MPKETPDLDEDLTLDPTDETSETETETEDELEEGAETESEEGAETETVEASEQETPRQQPSRRDSRIETLSRSVRERDQQIADLNRRMDMLLQQQPRQPPAGETPEAREQRLALLTPEERIREELRTDREQVRRELQGVAFHVQDSSDRAAFEAKATVDSLYEKWKPRVETFLGELRSKGQNVGREQAMFYLIGQNAVQQRHRAAGQQRTQGARRLAAQRTPAGNSRSDTQPTRRQGNNLERRLENVDL